ncbi:FAS1-like dehydratase domain-containing protein [Oceanobacillus salinisoli]|uniref:FAS1-like dehydratase domain-containing protein n=1 Tax=Oceanobacillus salinisoli TaxID=2678611 RepID=UPI0012E31AB5|nr:MaoC family dehydratase N-terminal domain-containing protein [Oceanobacillus salinisoli]
MQGDWKKEWQPMVDSVGQDFSNKGEEVVWGADEVEKGGIRRFLEPLEFDCALHYDEEVAQKHGYNDIIAPYSSILTWSIPPLWEPGKTVFTSEEKHSQPTESPLTGLKIDKAPSTTGYIVTDIEFEYFQPIVVGDRICKVGNVLLSCLPKETKIGKGAFMTWESKFLNQKDDLIAIVRMQTYSYNPYPVGNQEETGQKEAAN